MNDSKKTQISICVLLVALLIAIVLVTKEQYVVQYIIDGEMHTETFHSPSDCKDKVDSLKAIGIEPFTTR